MDQEVGPISNRALADDSAAGLVEFRGQRAFDWAAIEPVWDVREAFERTLTGWAGDLLGDRPNLGLATVDGPSGPGGPGESVDYRDRDWSRLYRGSVLDD